MNLLVISSAPVVKIEGQEFIYTPYEKEMQLWAKYASSIQFCCPVWVDDKKLLISPLSFKIKPTIELKEFDIVSWINVFYAVPNVLINSLRIFKAMQQADHIHLRCPGNMGLLGAVIQILFPKKIKTAKYAGNWDPQAKQPFTYRLQRWILSNTFLTKNMQVLVYGEWPEQSKNIKPFFTATYRETDKILVEKRNLLQEIRFVYAGTLSSGKRPFYVLQLVESLFRKGYKVRLDFYGEGPERASLEAYVLEHRLSEIISLWGNSAEITVRNAYQAAHFLVLPSQSEGWPKVVAEAMFWGCVPFSTAVSCVPYMLDHGTRGELLSLDIDADADAVCKLLGDEEAYCKKAVAAERWSRHYTLDLFEAEIKQLLQP